MDLQKLNVKFFVEGPDAISLTDFIDIFHGWIQATDGVYHDVADYSHMQAGPGIVLIANEANVSIDETENRRGLLFNQKSRLSGSNQEKLRTVFQGALEICRKLEVEPALRGKLRFATGEALISVNDRLLAGNSPDSFDAIRSDIEAFAKKLFGDGNVALDGNGDSRRRLSVRLKSAVPTNLQSLLKNLQHN
ncbi:MAG: hypothetical protein ACM3SP_24590 [Chloroflexota bacterium]